MRWTVLLEPDGHSGGYTVTVPALPAVVSEGCDLEHALAMARDAIRLELADRVADGFAVNGDLFDIQPLVASVEVAVPTLEQARDYLGDDWIPTIADPDEEWTLAVAADHFSVSAASLRQAIARNRLPSRVVGRVHVVRAADVVRYVATRRGRQARLDRRTFTLDAGW